MRFGRFEFRPRLLPSLFAAALCSLFVSLGSWQLGRADEKRAIMAAYEQRSASPPVAIDFAAEDIAGLRYQHVEVLGRFDADRQFLLDNKVRDGRAGYEVITPLRIPGREQLLLVNRGWVPQAERRVLLPDVGVAGDELRLTGTLYVPYGEGYRLGGMDEGQLGWPRVIQYLDFDEIAQRLGQPVAPFTLRLDARAPEGYRRDWRPVPFPAQRHIAYAVQWFALAAALVLIYFFVTIKRRSKP